MGRRSGAAANSQGGGRCGSCGVGRDDHVGPHDRLRLVRLRQAAAAGHRQRSRGLRDRLSLAARMSLLPFFEWCEQAPLIVAMRGSLWLFPVIEGLHLMGLALLGGAVVTVDLRLLGLGLRNQPVAQVARDAEKWLLISLAVMLPTGWLLFMASAVKCYY